MTVILTQLMSTHVSFGVEHIKYDANLNGSIGDIPGITSRLEYLAGLGVGALWLSPIFKSPMKDFGYDISDFTDVDPIFGTLDDFKEMADRAHDLG